MLDPESVWVDEFKKLGVELRLVSAATHRGLNELMQELSEKLFL